jgi:hypothetical protein
MFASNAPKKKGLQVIVVYVSLGDTGATFFSTIFFVPRAADKIA